MDKRSIALKWWYSLTKEEQFLHLKRCDEIVGYYRRNPSTLTGREIEILYTFKFKREKKKNIFVTFLECLRSVF